MPLRPRSGRLRSWQPGHNPALVVIPLALIVAVILTDVLLPPRIHLGPLLVAAPAVSVAFAGARLTALIGLLAVGAQMLIGVYRESLTSANIDAQIAALVVVSGLLVVFCLVRDRRERQLHRVRSVAEAAQHVLLRPLPRRSGPLQIGCLYLPAEEEAEMGGDLYAAARTPTSTRLLIGDVRGKGLAAISHAALLLGAFRAAAHRLATLPRLAVHLDGATRWDSSQWRSASCEDVDEFDVDEFFATATFLDLPDDEPVVHMIVCGHPPPLLFRDDQVTTLRPRASHLPIGLGGLVDSISYEVETFAFESGDLLLFYTDGVIEARDADGRFYPLAERAAAWAKDTPDDVVRHLRDDLLDHAHGHLGDDAAVVAIRRTPPN
ncbi:PP2C family protein-serine/threonine phosphatase [Streptantibioticus rubrisoli]|uniref:Serine/threonine-protein phosphatase n=1 Tax=Streptantibioticus rubrisoli TaxID=1387313 RepID=A0ABT1P7L1_9ACTN|nr:PP2C family protein-serine/threonine phosphatase [Streptantibioticus rubrisoli]MCQ4041365.1 serine/threonine-protein phosphatase [Streptantibioticus rubrisoli]